MQTIESISHINIDEIFEIQLLIELIKLGRFIFL